MSPNPSTIVMQQEEGQEAEPIEIEFLNELPDQTLIDLIDECLGVLGDRGNPYIDELRLNWRLRLTV